MSRRPTPQLGVPCSVPIAGATSAVVIQTGFTFPSTLVDTSLVTPAGSALTVDWNEPQWPVSPTLASLTVGLGPFSPVSSVSSILPNALLVRE